MGQELKRITYVEDEPDIRELARYALELLGGFSLSLCESGHEALREAPVFHPDLLLLDVLMPGMDGIQTLYGLRALEDMAATPAVFITAKAQEHEVAVYKSIGAAEVIPKPFDPMTLADDIRSIWDNCCEGYAA